MLFARTALRALPRITARRSYATHEADPVWTEPGALWWGLAFAGFATTFAVIYSRKDEHMKKLDWDNARQRPECDTTFSKWGRYIEGRWGKE
ncbi:hypothetical protein RQP46_008238 [Phenoliferia psychrophenolica]